MLLFTRISCNIASQCSRTFVENNPWSCRHLNSTIIRQTSSLSTRKIDLHPVTRTLWFSIASIKRAAVTSIQRRGLSSSVPLLAYRSSKKLPFEVDLKVAKNTLLYEHKNERFFRMLSIFGLAQLVFWGQLAIFSYTSLGAIDTLDCQSVIQKDTFWGKVIMLQTHYKGRIAGLCASVGTLVLFFTFIYPRRTIQRLMLLKGGQDLHITTYTHFGKTRSFTAPVNHLSVLAARASNASQVSLKLKNHRFFYLMDKADGKFHDIQLFDYAVGIKRTL